MATAYLLSQNPNPTEDEIREGLEGNLCRCTGYVNIIKAVQYAARRWGRTDVSSQLPLRSPEFPESSHQPAEAVRRRCQGPGRRPQPHPDDEATAGAAEV